MMRSFVLGLLILCCCGCVSEYNLATNRQEMLLYGTEKEIKIGQAISYQLEKNYKLVPDRDVNERVQAILDRLEAVADRQDVVYTVRVLDEDEVNAVSLPGGYIYVFKGLLDKVENDDQLAGVIAHEIGHVTAKHAMKRLQASYGYTLLQILAVETGTAAVTQGVNALYLTAFLAYSKQDEFEADRLAVKYTRAAGYDPEGMIRVLEILREENAKELRPLNYFRTHPYPNERIAALNTRIRGHMDFRDYLNLIGSE